MEQATAKATGQPGEFEPKPKKSRKKKLKDYRSLGEYLARTSRGEELEAPSEDDLKHMPMNRAEYRDTLRVMPRDIRIQTFGNWRVRHPELAESYGRAK